MKKGSLSRSGGKRKSPGVTPQNSENRKPPQGSSGVPGQSPRVVVDDQRPSTSKAGAPKATPSSKRPRKVSPVGRPGENIQDGVANPPRPKVLKQPLIFFNTSPPPPADPLEDDEGQECIILSNTDDSDYHLQTHDEEDSEDTIFLSDNENYKLLAGEDLEDLKDDHVQIHPQDQEDLVGEEESEQEKLVKKISKDRRPADYHSRLLITKGRNLFANLAVLEFFERQTTPFSRDLVIDSLVVELFLRQAGSNMGTDMISWRPSVRSRPAQYMIRKGTIGRFQTISAYLVIKNRGEKPDQIVDAEEDEEESDDSAEAGKPEEIQRIYEDSLPLAGETLEKIRKESNPKANLDVLLFIEERTTRFSMNRETEMRVIKMLLSNAGSNISPGRIVWKSYLSKKTRKKRRSLHRPKYLLAFLSKGKTCHMTLTDYVKGCENKRYRVYAGICVAERDMDSTRFQNKEDLLKVLLDKDVPLAMYVGKRTDVTKFVTDVSKQHFNDAGSALLQHMAKGNKKRCLSVLSLDMVSGEKQEELESYAIINLSALNNPRIQTLNKANGARINSEKVLKAIELGRRGIGLINFERADGHAPEDPYDLNFPLNTNHLKDVTDRFQLDNAYLPQQQDVGELHSVYVAVAFPDFPADNAQPNPSFKTILDGKARPMSVCIGRSLQVNLRHGIRNGHFGNDADCELLRIASTGQVYRVRTFRNLTLQESKDLESLLIFFAYGYEDAAAKNANGVPTFQCLNKAYGAMISSDLAYSAVSLGLSSEKFFVEGKTSDIYSLPIPVRKGDFFEITDYFNV